MAGGILIFRGGSLHIFRYVAMPFLTLHSDEANVLIAGWSIIVNGYRSTRPFNDRADRFE
jgi:hypothetical protein